jgi:hypothetical protein
VRPQKLIKQFLFRPSTDILSPFVSLRINSAEEPAFAFLLSNAITSRLDRSDEGGSFATAQDDEQKTEKSNKDNIGENIWRSKA